MARIKATFEFESTDAYPIDDIRTAAENLHMLVKQIMLLNIAKAYETRTRKDISESTRDAMLSCLETDRKVTEEMLSSMNLEPSVTSMGEMYGPEGDDHDACLTCGLCKTCGDCTCSKEDRLDG